MIMIISAVKFSQFSLDSVPMSKIPATSGSGSGAPDGGLSDFWGGLCHRFGPTPGCTGTSLTSFHVSVTV